tara:strand:+ start:580 stop:1599 length:1020 start_codon:yes stop_codon:yes gene_type:complete
MDIKRVDIQSHQPVLIKSLIDQIAPVTGVWVDCTFGAGGYSKALLEAGAQKIIGLDRDPSASVHANKLKATYGTKIEFYKSKFSSLETIVAQLGLKKIAGVVFDVGLSSMQIDEASRGFSHQQAGPLDMRMSQNGITAADIINNATEEELADIIYFYGEVKSARTIARAIITERAKKEIVSTDHLATIVNRVSYRWRAGGKKKSNSCTLTFQALRIAVNNELEELNSGLIAAEKVLAEGATLAVVSFHSLEDRLVKQFIKSRSKRYSGQSRYLPHSNTLSPTFRELLKKVVRPDDEEVATNSRARSGKLRLAIKLKSNKNDQSKSLIKFPQVQFSLGQK